MDLISGLPAAVRDSDHGGILHARRLTTALEACVHAIDHQCQSAT
jgi:hypothetical protein